MKRLIYLLILIFFNVDKSYALLDSELVVKYKHRARFNAVGRVVRADGTFATGTLIAPNVVLTAAHVLRDPDCYKRHCVNDGVYYTGKFHGTVNFEIESGGKTYVYRATAGRNFYDYCNGPIGPGPCDVGVFKLTQPVPLAIAKPFEIAGSNPNIGTPGYMFGYGCHSTYYDPQQANGTNILYAGNYKDNFFGKKQIVVRNYGDWAYQACFGDSGGPLLNQNDLSIYAVISSSDFNKSDDERRNSPTNANFAGKVSLFFNSIRDYINNYRTVCEVSKKTESGKIIYGLGRCIPKDKVIDWEAELPSNLKGNLIKDRSSCVNPKENVCVELRGNTDWDY